MRYVLYCLLGVNYLLALNARFTGKLYIESPTSTDRFVVALLPVLFMLLIALGFRKKRKSFGYFGIAAMVLGLACLMYALLPGVQ